MGRYLNPGTVNFEEALNSNIYIDKTEMIQYINSVVKTKQKYMCVSRPRRFGKTMATDMLCAYFGKCESKKLFEDLKIAKLENWDRYINRFDVVKLVMTDFIKVDQVVSKGIEKMTQRLLEELSEEYPEVKYDAEDLPYSMDKFFRKSGKQFVIIIDEWDVVFRACKEDKDGQRFYLDFLRDWLKDQEFVALAYMTGILPVKKYGQHSALNMFREFSIITPMQLAPYTGITEEEVQKICKEYGRSYEKIKEWYNGYDITDVIPPDPNYSLQNSTVDELKPRHYSIYSPLSVIEAVSSGVVQNYWNKTETYEALAEYIRMNLDGLKDSVALLMDGGRVKVTVSKYQNDMTSFNGSNDVLVMLIHLGYLGYDAETKEVFIPNREILDEFKASTESEEWVDTFKSFRKSEELLEATWNANEEKVSRILEWFHDFAENKTYNSEAALLYAIQMAYYAGQRYYTTIQELDTGKGYADLCYLPSPKNPDKPALLIELKYNRSVEVADDQIRRKEYLQKMEHYKGNILIISVNYNKDVKSEEYMHHVCRIERG
ncbi:MAG: AAA family ATPase [Lachnospiraceae bacterium]|nr:AAA family ATPase [Lachnospiraceae bacterium]